jgi:hypothetical protein
MVKVKKWSRFVSDRLREAMEEAEIIENARVFWFQSIRHPMNIAEWVLPKQKMTLEQIYREMWTSKEEKKKEWLQLMSHWESGDLAEYKRELRKKLKEWLKENAESYLASVFNWKETDIQVKDKARLALDVLKATDRDYNQQINAQVNVNLNDLPLWDWLLEAQKKLILELGITWDIFSQIEDEQK